MQLDKMFSFSSRRIAQLATSSLLKSILPSSYAQPLDSLNTAICGSYVTRLDTVLLLGMAKEYFPGLAPAEALLSVKQVDGHPEPIAEKDSNLWDVVIALWGHGRSCSPLTCLENILAHQCAMNAGPRQVFVSLAKTIIR